MLMLPDNPWLICNTWRYQAQQEMLRATKEFDAANRTYRKLHDEWLQTMEAHARRATEVY
jgi:hypothetical protein